MSTVFVTFGCNFSLDWYHETHFCLSSIYIVWAVGDILGFDWRVARAADVSGDSAVISMPGYADSDWVAAPVPGTVAVAYREAGLLPDMRYDDNLMSVDYDFSMRISGIVPNSGVRR